jgi:hypothetical protein
MQFAEKLRFLLLPAMLAVSVHAADTPPDDLLRGPTVTSSARAPGLPMLRTGAQMRAIQRQAVPVRRWFTEFAALPLDEEQQVRFTSLKRDFNVVSEEYKNEYGKTLSRARSELRRLVGERDSPIVERDEAAILRGRELQSRINEIEQLSPKANQLQLACWNLLTDEQKELFRGRLKEIRDKLRAERARAEEKRGREAMQEAGDAMQPSAEESDVMQETPKRPS